MKVDLTKLSFKILSESSTFSIFINEKNKFFNNVNIIKLFNDVSIYDNREIIKTFIKLINEFFTL